MRSHRYGARRRTCVETECDNCFERGPLRVVRRRAVEPAPNASVARLLWDVAVLGVCAFGVLLVGLVQALAWLTGTVVTCYTSRPSRTVTPKPAGDAPIRAPRRPDSVAATTKRPPTESASATDAKPTRVEPSLDEQVENLAKRLYAEHKKVMSPATAELIARRHLEARQATLRGTSASLTAVATNREPSSLQTNAT